MSTTLGRLAVSAEQAVKYGQNVDMAAAAQSAAVAILCGK